MGNQYYWVYIILCQNNAYYTGYTHNIAKRYQSHLSGTGKCKYTRSFKPIALAQCWKIQGNRALAMRIERQIKQLSRDKKEQLIAHPATLSTDHAVIAIEYHELSVLNRLNMG
ncbi:MAG: hypothetical protein CK424_05265 [Legionella sp.]|nr:MAG: hypothetical protein CK424_05265 [Legionella sp.]